MAGALVYISHVVICVKRGTPGCKKTGGNSGVSMVEWKNSNINKLLKASAANADTLDDFDGARVSWGNIAFVLFLEPPEHTDPNMTTGEHVIDNLIQTFSEKPTMVHVEVVLPPFSRMGHQRNHIHFATYLGSHADYQNQYDAISGVDFYLIRHGQRWRCLPVFGENAVESLKRACDANVGSPYSLFMYPTSCQLFRKYSWIWSDAPRHKGHCATITARVLRQAGIECGVVKASPWYSPSSLYASIHEDLKTRLSKSQVVDLKASDPEACEKSIETILRGPLSARSMQELGHEKCIEAIRHLAYNVVNATVDVTGGAGGAGGADSERCHAERELGDAVLKWALLGRSV